MAIGVGKDADGYYIVIDGPADTSGDELSATALSIVDLQDAASLFFNDHEALSSTDMEFEPTLPSLYSVCAKCILMPLLSGGLSAGIECLKKICHYGRPVAITPVGKSSVTIERDEIGKWSPAKLWQWVRGSGKGGHNVSSDSL